MKEFTIISDPEDLPASRYSVFKKALMMKLTIGDDLKDFQSKFGEIKKAFDKKDDNHFYTELGNMYGNFHNIKEGNDLDVECLLALTKYKDGEEEEARNWLLSLPKKELSQKVLDIKKKFLPS